MTGSIPGVPGNELLQSLSADLTAVMRQEFQALQNELTNPFLRYRTGARLLEAPPCSARWRPAAQQPWRFGSWTDGCPRRRQRRS